MQLENKIIEKIERENIRPLPRWRFVVENRLEWLLEIALFALGSLITVLIWNSLGRNLSRLSLGSIPYLMLAVLVLIMLVMRRFSFRLNWGYGLAPLVFLGLFLVSNAALGTLMHFNKIPQAAEVQLKRLPPSVHKVILPEIEELEEEIENSPEQSEGGRLESDEIENGVEEEELDEDEADEGRESDERDEEGEARIRRKGDLSGSLMRSDAEDDADKSDGGDSDVDDDLDQEDRSADDKDEEADENDEVDGEDSEDDTDDSDEDEAVKD